MRKDDEDDCDRILASHPTHRILPAKPAGEVYFPTSRARVEIRKLNEIATLIFIPEGLNEAEKNARIVRALELYESLKPADAAEGMLAAQMVGTHHAALDCLRQAKLEGQTFAGRDMLLKHAQKLMALYTQQMAALDKHRGKGQQKVTVEHVHVHSGGQAIVGSVERDEVGDRGHPKEIEHKSSLGTALGDETAVNEDPQRENGG